MREIHLEELPARVRALPGLEAIAEAAAGIAVYLVGGSVRDLLLDRPRADVDVCVEGDATPVAERLGAVVRLHDRFGTATVEVDGLEVDLATARRETYAHPGALPEVEPASISEDLARRDFSVNAMAIPLDRDPVIIDPHGGLEDLRRGFLRTLHPRSFLDDPTRALRAARYAARFGFELEPGTEAALIAADLDTVSRGRVQAELRKLAIEDEARRGFELLDDWGLIELPEGAMDLVDAARGLTERAPWTDICSRAEAVLGAVTGVGERARDLASERPRSPSEAVALTSGRDGCELLLARAQGAGWLDDWAGRLRHVRLDISGEDLLAAGIPQGPAIGRGLAAALDAKLDGRASGRQEELEAALSSARER